MLGSRNKAVSRIVPTFMEVNILTAGETGEQLIKMNVNP